MMGIVHSIQSLGTVDGPGVRFVLFLKGCPLRCACCHNPDTWEIQGGEEYTPRQILDKVIRYREYFGSEGGITVSGGEPLLQADFVEELFALCREQGINTCLDTSGCVINESVQKLLKVTDRILLDIKYATDELYEKYVGCSLKSVLDFLKITKEIPVTVRQVIIPTLNDNEENLDFLKRLKQQYHNIDKIELLAFKKICQVKYDNMGIEFPFKDMPQPDKALMEKLQKILND